MIVTKEWLNEWCDLKDIKTEDICKTLNSIGLEIESINSIKIPKKVVVAKVLSCNKHKDADKLSVCEVDVGDKTLQIVCGAKNVKADQFVAVALEGAVLDKDFTIKKTKLRGVESNGMICSSTEIGLPFINDGIMLLDESIGKLELGKELCKYPLLNDDIIEIELTANRGDCLSVFGVARDLSAALQRELKEVDLSFKEDRRGVARVLKLHSNSNEKLSSSIKLKFLELHDLSLNLLYKLRLAFVDKEIKDGILGYIDYASYSSGVIMRGYDFDKIAKGKNELTLILKKDQNSLEELVSENGEILSKICLNQNSKFLPDKNSKKVIIECSYIDPKEISLKQFKAKVKSDDSFYKASRGSESDLSFGMNYFCSILSNVSIYSGSQNHIVEKEPLKLKIDFDFFERFIGQKLPKKEIINILKRLYFDIKDMVVTVPLFRHDIQNSQDIVEEIVRIYGIDNITSKPLELYEKNRLNNSYIEYKKSLHFKQKAVGVGYFESIHYCFDNRQMMKKYNLALVKEEFDLTNPITNELNTLRSTLLLHLLNSASNNKKFGKKKIKLFELGVVFDENRVEHKRLSFIFSGEVEEAKLSNHAKPKEVDFFTFAEDIASVVGKIELQKATKENSLVSPYEYARVILNSNDIGFIARVHAKIEEELSLSPTYICELDFDKLDFDLKIVKPYSKFPSLSRDLSILVSKDMEYIKIKKVLMEVLPKEVIEFFPIDLFKSDEFKDRYSLTLRFILQSDSKTLSENEIVDIMDKIVKYLKEKLSIEIR